MFNRRRLGALLFIYGVCNNKEEEIKEEEEPRQRNALKLWRMTRSVQMFMHSFIKEPFIATLYFPHLDCNLMVNVSRKLLMLAVQLLNQRAGSPAG